MIAGKGHEEKQIYKNKILNISDKKIVRKINIKTKIKSIKDQNYQQNKLVLHNICGKKKLLNFNGLSTDTRTIKKGNLFLAIKGKKIDGNKFINVALKKRAGCIISSKIPKKMIKKL